MLETDTESEMLFISGRTCEDNLWLLQPLLPIKLLGLYPNPNCYNNFLGGSQQGALVFRITPVFPALLETLCGSLYDVYLWQIRIDSHSSKVPYMRWPKVKATTQNTDVFTGTYHTKEIHSYI